MREDDIVKSIRDYMFPELAKFIPGEDRDAAYSAAHRGPDVTDFLIVITCLVACYAGVMLIAPFVLTPIHRHIGRHSYQYGSLLLGLLFLGFAVLRRGQQRTRLELRRRLAQRGELVCVPCGYNLRSNISGVCPECGTKIPPSENPWYGPKLPGYCRKCDHDLTGNVSGVCPECGTKIEEALLSE